MLKNINKQLVLAVLVTLITAGVIGFFSGRIYEQRRAASRFKAVKGARTLDRQNDRMNDARNGFPGQPGSGMGTRTR